jgi:hypothetical protein
MELKILDDLFDDPYSDDELDENIALGLALDPDTHLPRGRVVGEPSVPLQFEWINFPEQSIDRARGMKTFFATLREATVWQKWERCADNSRKTEVLMTEVERLRPHARLANWCEARCETIRPGTDRQINPSRTPPP